MGVSRDCPNFSGTPYYLRNGKGYGFQIWLVHPEGPFEQKPMKNFGEKEAWAYPGTAEIFDYVSVSRLTSTILLTYLGLLLLISCIDFILDIECSVYFRAVYRDIRLWFTLVTILTPY